MTTTDYVGNNGRIRLNMFLGTDGSSSDRLVINGATASGTTGLLIDNTRGGGALTVHDGILVMQSINGASTTSNAFRQGKRVAAGPLNKTLYYDGRAKTGGNPNDQNWYLQHHTATAPRATAVAWAADPQLP